MNLEMVDLKNKLDSSKDKLDERIKEKDRIIKEIEDCNSSLGNKLKEKDIFEKVGRLTLEK